MPPSEDGPALGARIASLAEFLSTSDAIRVRIEREDEEIELARSVRSLAYSSQAVAAEAAAAEAPPRPLEAIKADLVGIVRFSRPAPFEGEVLDQDRELAFIEALGMRTPVHSLGGGQIVTVAVGDGVPVEYGQPLFLLDRG